MHIRPTALAFFHFSSLLFFAALPEICAISAQMLNF